MSINFRCTCSITSALDILGDKWMLVIVKQMLFEDAETFKDFLERPEAISTNILSTKLKLLEEIGIATKSKPADNKKTNLYHLTEMGLSLAPLIIELALWSDSHLRELHKTMGDRESLQNIRENKEAYCEKLVREYREKVTKGTR